MVATRSTPKLCPVIGTGVKGKKIEMRARAASTKAPETTAKKASKRRSAWLRSPEAGNTISDKTIGHTVEEVDAATEVTDVEILAEILAEDLFAVLLSIIT